jgi:hypothetical protein
MPAKCLIVEAVSREQFETDLRLLSKPVVMKGQISAWPAIQAARQSDAAIGDYLKQFDAGVKTPVSVLPAQEDGLYFYNSDATGLNYRTVSQLLPNVIDLLLQRAGNPGGDSLYMQSLPVDMFLPSFARENTMSLLDQTVRPRIWIGNRLAIQTHYDQASNLACLVAGRRRFTLFPPGQLENLYPGPDDFTPGGTPVSMAPLSPPDFERYPRLREALKHAVVAEMDPGDVLYIPYGWWHQVESLSGFNILVNYWWNDAGPSALSPGAAFKAAVLGLKDLPAEQRVLWKALFDYYIFETTGDPVAHLPQTSRGSLGGLTPDLIRRLKADIRAIL